VSDPLIYIDRSGIRDGRLEELRKGVRELVDFVETQEPQLIAYGFYFNERGTDMTVVAVFPDSESMEFHLEIGGPAFRKLSEHIELRTIDVYGRPSEKVLGQLQHKMEMLGGSGRVLVHQMDAGIMRFVSPAI
jgi:hypothetical protein